LYRNSLLAQYDLPAALDHLYQIEDIVCSPGVVYEFEADYLSKLDDRSKQEDLVKAWERLVDRNPENKTYLYGLEKANNIPITDRKTFWRNLAVKYPKATSIKVIPLGFLEGNGLILQTDDR
jgi:NMDA receptor-regulated protein 1